MHCRLVLLFAAAFCAVLAGCARIPPEQALRQTIAELQSAIDRREAAAVQAHLAEDFIGTDGLDREGARRMAQVMFMRYRDIGATVSPLEIAMQERNATVRFTAVLTGGANGLLPETGQLYAVQTGWRLDDDEWLLTSMHWEPKL